MFDVAKLLLFLNLSLTILYGILSDFLGAIAITIYSSVTISFYFSLAFIKAYYLKLYISESFLDIYLYISSGSGYRGIVMKS